MSVSGGVHKTCSHARCLYQVRDLMVDLVCRVLHNLEYASVPYLDLWLSSPSDLLSFLFVLTVLKSTY